MKQGTATLTGSVTEQQDIERAKRIARRVPGVRQVNSNLSVSADRATGPTDLGDEELAKQVAQRIHSQVFPGADLDEQWTFGWEIDADDWELEVEADGGTIILEGEVETADQLRRAIQAARNHPGVRSVDATGVRLDTDFYGYAPYRGYGWPYYG